MVEVSTGDFAYRRLTGHEHFAILEVVFAFVLPLAEWNSGSWCATSESAGDLLFPATLDFPCGKIEVRVNPACRRIVLRIFDLTSPVCLLAVWAMKTGNEGDPETSERKGVFVSGEELKLQDLVIYPLNCRKSSCAKFFIFSFEILRQLPVRKVAKS